MLHLTDIGGGTDTLARIKPAPGAPPRLGLPDYKTYTGKVGEQASERRQKLQHTMGPRAGDAEAQCPPQDALTYVRAVKSRFQAAKPEVYEAFLEVMRDFKNAR